MKLTKQQTEALATQLTEEIWAAKKPQIDAKQARNKEEVETRMSEILDSSEYNEVLQGMDLISGFIENPNNGLPSLVRETHYRCHLKVLDHLQEDIEKHIREEVTFQVSEENLIEHPPTYLQIEREIILQTIEVENLDSLITRIKNKFI